MAATTRTTRRTPVARPAATGADLLAHVARDLDGCELVRRSTTVADVTPPTGPAFEVEVRRERRKLIDVHVLAVHVHGPVTDTSATGAASTGPVVRAGSAGDPRADREIDAAIVCHHRGQLRRTGLAAKVSAKGRGEVPAAVVALRDRLLAGGELERVSLPLDFTSFEVRRHGGAWRATLELMGASYVRTTFPPAAHYVRLHDDQVAALLATVAVLHERLPGRVPPVAPSVDDRHAASFRSASDHLPRSRA